MAATTCALCRKAVYAKTRHGSSLIKHFASEKISSASSKRGRVAASSTQGRALKRNRSAENAGSGVFPPGAEQLHTPTPSHPEARPSNPRTSAHFHGVDWREAWANKMGVLSKLHAPILDTLRPRDARTPSPNSPQLAQLRYDSLVHGGKWLGKSIGSDRWEPTRSDFVRSNFEPWFVKECRQRDGRCVKVPAGDADVGRAAQEFVLNGFGKAGLATHASPPEVRFPQGKVNSCVFSGAASALASLGDARGALVLAEVAQASAHHMDPMTFLYDTLRNNTAWDPQGVSEGTHDALQSNPNPTCIQIRCSDGAVNHSITTVGDWVFDSSEHFALPLCQESLDRCAGQGVKFVGCVRVFRLVPSVKLAKALAQSIRIKA